MRRGLIWTGISFAVLWASAATATSIGLQSVQPLVLALTRFAIAGVIMLLITHLFLGNRLPRKGEWKSIVVYGILNISLYLGLYVWAMQSTAAGLASLSIAINPVLISIMAAFVFRYKIGFRSILSLVICTVGVLIAAWPLLKSSHSSSNGLILLFLSMIAYSGGAIYYSRCSWNGLHILTINGWQTLAGGIFLLPVTLILYHKDRNIYDQHFWLGTLWLAIPVSIIAVLAWMRLLKQNPIQASYWLYLCPIFGFLLAALLLKEPLSEFTVAGCTLVITGLYLVQQEKLQKSFSSKIYRS